METFDIRLGKYQVTGELIYQSKQVSRFKITLQNKYFVLEQRHLNKSAKWKIKEYSPDVDLNKVMECLNNIISEIENYINPREGHANYLRRTKL